MHLWAENKITPEEAALLGIAMLESTGTAKD
jgi:hypothetical protein